MKIIKCNYCGSRININDNKCPNCGADVTDVIEKHLKEEQEAKEKILKERDIVGKKEQKKFDAIFIGIVCFIGIVGLGIVFILFNTISDAEKKISKSESPIVINLSDEGSTKNYTVTCDEVKEYNIVADYSGFTTGVAKEGYQQLAFHISMTNKNEKEINFFFDEIEIILLADGEQMTRSSLTGVNGFSHEENDQQFSSLQDKIAGNATIKGYVGFYVSKTAKELELRVGKVTIKMDNPAYNAEK